MAFILIITFFFGVIKKNLIYTITLHITKIYKEMDWSYRDLLHPLVVRRQGQTSRLPQAQWGPGKAISVHALFFLGGGR